MPKGGEGKDESDCADEDSAKSYHQKKFEIWQSVGYLKATAEAELSGLLKGKTKTGEWCSVVKLSPTFPVILC